MLNGIDSSETPWHHLRVATRKGGANFVKGPGSQVNPAAGVEIKISSVGPAPIFGWYPMIPGKRYNKQRLPYSDICCKFHVDSKHDIPFIQRRDSSFFSFLEIPPWCYEVGDEDICIVFYMFFSLSPQQLTVTTILRQE